jgi:hypothetical protein
MANLLMQPGPDPVLATRHHGFAEFYCDPTLDPFHGEYARIMERFDPNINNVLSHVLLLGQAFSCGSVPQAYLCCA